nr:cysteine-rich secretory protein [Steinernema carpocapsae]
MKNRIISAQNVVLRSFLRTRFVSTSAHKYRNPEDADNSVMQEDPAGGPSCPSSGSQLKPADRANLLAQHNKLRSQNARGRSQDGPSGGFAPKAKNMYKLIYSCDLENMAQKWSNGCVFKHSPQQGRNAGENIYAIFPAQNSNTPVMNATDSWWAELKNIGVGKYSPNFTLTMDVFNAGTGHYTQMAWGATTEVGCGIAQCTSPKSMTFVVCNYRIAGNLIGSPIYAIGSPCSQDNDCTTYKSSTCSKSEGLCIKN